MSKDLHVIFHCLSAEELSFLIERLDEIGAAGYRPLFPPRCAPRGICIRFDRRSSLSGIMNHGDLEWYTSRPPFNNLKVIRATKENIESFFGHMSKKQPDKKPKFVIGVHGDQRLSRLVQSRILFPSGYTWADYGNSSTRYENGFTLYCQDPPYISVSNSAYKNYVESSSFKDFEKFDAKTEWFKMLKRFGIKHEPMKIDEIAPAGLIELIKSQPGNEVTVGLIRRDIGIAMPADVVAGGSKSIVEFIEKEYNRIATEGGEIAAPSMTPNITDREVTISISDIMRGTGRISRTDSIMVTMTVPADVIAGAVNERDPDIISLWILENHTDEHISVRQRGSVEVDHYDEEDMEGEDPRARDEILEQGQADNIVNELSQ